MAHHRARLDPGEPIFTQRSFVEKNIELDVGWTGQADGQEVALSAAAGWVFARRLEIDVEIPTGLQIPDDGATTGSLDDVAAGVQLLVCCAPEQILDYLSLRLDVGAPTGSRAKDIGGTGSWQVSLLPGRLQTLLPQLPDLLVQAQLAYAEQLRPDAGSEAIAASLGREAVRQKQVLWNLAFTQPVAGGRVRPVLEMLGTSIVDAEPGGTGTSVELAAGFWLVPFADEHPLSALSLALGWRWPATRFKQEQASGLFIAEWSFGT